MTNEQRINRTIYKNGHSATVTVVAGDVCPCMIFEDANNPSYSREWHRLNPTADDCSGTGLINTSSNDTNIKAMFYPVALKVQSLNLDKESLDKILGEMQNDDLIMYGAVDISDLSTFDLSILSEYHDKILYRTNYYFVRHLFEIAADSFISQIAFIKRLNG